MQHSADRNAPHSLEGRIALVAGATRGAGRAIARELARAGAVVYCTGRSTAQAPSDYGRSETVEGTAQLITDAGGTAHRSEEHTSELQSRGHLVCRLLLEKKKKKGKV